MSALPTEFVAAWERVELAVEGSPIVDAGIAYWLQGPEHFVDVRCAGGGVPEEAFAGVTTWDARSETLRWHRSIDHSQRADQDLGRVEWHDGDLVEHGTADVEGARIDYTEIWRRRSQPGEAVVIAECVDARGLLACCSDTCAVAMADESGKNVLAGLAGRASLNWEFRYVVGVGEIPTGGSCGSRIGQQFVQFGERWKVLEVGTSL